MTLCLVRSYLALTTTVYYAEVWVATCLTSADDSLPGWREKYVGRVPRLTAAIVCSNRRVTRRLAGLSQGMCWGRLAFSLRYDLIGVGIRVASSVLFLNRLRRVLGELQVF